MSMQLQVTCLGSAMSGPINICAIVRMSKTADKTINQQQPGSELRSEHTTFRRQ